MDGDGGRSTYGVIEHFLQWRWPELLSGAEYYDYSLGCSRHPDG
jgi:hypothetical protein